MELEIDSAKTVRPFVLTPFRTKAPSTPATMSKNHCGMLQVDSFDKGECCAFNKVETNRTCLIRFDFVERIVRLVAFDDVASTLLLVWTRPNTASDCLSPIGRYRTRNGSAPECRTGFSCVVKALI